MRTSTIHARMSVLLLTTIAAATAVAQPSSSGPLAPPANGPRRADATWTALYNCTVHVAPGKTLEHATVVFKDGLIAEVVEAHREKSPDGNKTKAGQLLPGQVPAGAFSIDCTGLHVYPGFIDPYVEVDAPPPTGDASTKHWSPKVTPQRSALDGAGVDERTADSLRKLGFTTAAISPRGGVFRGTSAVVSLAKPAEDASAARPPVYLDRAYQSVAFELGGGYPGSEMGAIAMIRQTLIDADWQVSARAAGEKLEPNCLDLIGQGKSPARTPLLFNTDDDLEPLRCIKIADEFSRDFLLLGSGSEYQRLAALDAALRIKHINAPAFRSTILLPLNFPKTPDVSSIGKAENAELRDLMHWEQAPTNPRRLATSGIPFALTTAKLRDRGEFRRNLQTALKHGLKEDQALAALTTSPAQLFHLAGSLGTVEQGKRANLILADGPIFGDKTKLRSVYIDGVAHELNPAPIDLEGRWDISPTPGAPGVNADPNAPDHAQRWFAIDKDNGITVHRDKKSVKASKVSVERDRLSFAFDNEPLNGQTGVSVVSAIIERDNGPHAAAVRFSGSALRPTGESSPFIAQRTPPSPLVGTWRVTKYDDQEMDPRAKEGLTIAITEGTVTLTFTKDKKKAEPGEQPKADQAAPSKPDDTKTEPAAKPEEKAAANKVDTADDTEKVEMTEAEKASEPASDKDGEKADKPKRYDNGDLVIKCDDVVLKGRTLTFTHDLAKLGTEGKSSDTVTFEVNGDSKDDDSFTGVGTLPDGSKHTYQAIRTPREGTEIAEGLWMTEEEAARIKAIPEKLPTPFGPYGLEADPAQPTIVFKNATLWTNSEKGVIPGGVVVIGKGKILAAGRDFNLPLPPGEVIEIDLKGKHITPGIIDAHSHTGISRGVNEGGQAVTSEVRIGDVTDADDVDWYRQLAGGVTTVQQLHGSANAIGGQSQTTKLRWGVANPDDMHFEGAMPGIKFALGENPRQVNFGGGGRASPARYPSTRMGVEQIIRDRFTAAREYDMEHASEYLPERIMAAQSSLVGLADDHSKTDELIKEMEKTVQTVPSQERNELKRALASAKQNRAALEAHITAAKTRLALLKQAEGRQSPSSSRKAQISPPRRDLELEALAEILRGERLVHCHSYRQDEMIMLCNVAKDFDFKIGTLQHALEAYKVADYALKYTGGASGFADWWAYKVEVQDAIPGAFPLMHDVGLLVSYNSDSNELARRLNVDAAKAVKYGHDITPEEALKFVTLNPAKQLRIDSRVGSLEVGKDADLVIWSGEPLSAFSKAEATYVDGRCLFSLEQDAKHRETIRAERQRLIQKILSEGKARKPEGDKKEGDEARPDGPRPEGGRRRRPPQDADASYSYYMNLFTSGKQPNELPGDCGESDLQFDTIHHIDSTTK